MNTDSLRQLLALADTGSYSGAAAISGVTQPAISLTVKKMEKDLGVKLFERVGNRYVPTDAGRILLKHAGEILDAESRLLASLQRAAGSAPVRLRVATSNIPGEYVLPLILGDFRSEKPHIEPVLEVMDSSRVVESLRSGGFEVGFIGISIDPGDLEVTPFCPDVLRVICHPAHPLSGRKAVRPQQLAQEKFLLREEGSGTKELMVKAFREAGLDMEELRVEMELGSTSSVISAVESGAGISLVSAWAARGPFAEGKIGYIQVPRLKVRRRFSLVRVKKRPLSPAAKPFVDFVISRRGFLGSYARSIGAA
ncbi:MAG: LysR family transcriptional regulator [Actinomycetota bacterium]|nr:LysR family transcriptional regulator [Actinomycetota bacterium]MDD5666434.1 LysR family transcriptional regulator [Actinomycetota bacterium]